MHWVYVLALADDRIYVGETTRLFSRLREHFESGGARLTSRFQALRLIGLYKASGLESDKDVAMRLEDDVTLHLMHSYMSQWWLVRGGRFVDDFLPNKGPVASYKCTRPFCGCGLPAEIIQTSMGPVYKCCRQAQGKFWTDSVLTQFTGGAQPCTGYMKWNDAEPLTPTTDSAWKNDRESFRKFMFVDADDITTLVSAATTKLEQALSSFPRLYVVGHCSAKECVCSRWGGDPQMFYEAKNFGIDNYNPYDRVAREPESKGLCLMRVNGGASLRISFTEEPAAAAKDKDSSVGHVVLSAREVLNAEHDDELGLIVTDRTPGRNDPTCAWLDEHGATLPCLGAFAPRGRMRQCIGCCSRDYKSVLVAGQHRQLCKLCVQNKAPPLFT